MIPFLYTAWRNAQCALVHFAKTPAQCIEPALNATLLSHFCRQEPTHFTELEMLYTTYIRHEPILFVRKQARQHLAALRSVVRILQSMARTRRHRIWQPTIRIQRHILAIMILISSGILGAGILLASQAPVSGSGLTARYYKSDSFTGRRKTRLDKTVDFNWRDGAPLKKIPKNHFSVIWDGTVIIKNGERKRFAAAADDGVQVFVDDELIIDNLGPHRFSEIRSKRIFGAGNHKVKIKYVEKAGAARIRFSWTTQNGYWSVVPAERLRPEGWE